MPLFNNDQAKQKASSVGLFSNLQHAPFNVEKLANNFRHRDLGWTIPEAYLAILMLAAMADGKFDDAEKALIQYTVRRSPALRGFLERGEFGAIEQSVMQRIDKDKETALDEACMTLPGDMCLSVFAHTIDLMLADNEFADSEKNFVEALHTKLDITEDYARRILEVQLLKNRY